MSDAALKATQEALRATGAELKKATDENARLRAELDEAHDACNEAENHNDRTCEAVKERDALQAAVGRVTALLDARKARRGFESLSNHEIREALNEKED